MSPIVIWPMQRRQFRLSLSPFPLPLWGVAGGKGLERLRRRFEGRGRVLFSTYLIITQCLSKYFLLSSNSPTAEDQPNSYMHFPYPLQIYLISAFPSSGQILFFFLISLILQSCFSELRTNLIFLPNFFYFTFLYGRTCLFPIICYPYTTTNGHACCHYLSKWQKYILLSYLNLQSGQTHQLCSLLHPSARVGMGKIAGSPLFPFPWAGTGDKGQSIYSYKTFPYCACFTLPPQPLMGWRWEV